MFDSIALFRVIKTGFVNFWRNFRLSAAATIVTTITLIIFASLFLLFAMTSYSIKNVQKIVDITVSFKVGADESRILQIRDQLKTNPKVSSVEYVTPDQVLENFKTRNAEKPTIIRSLNELSENPFGAAFHVKAYNLDDYQSIYNFLNGDQFNDVILKINYVDTKIIIDRLSQILHYIIIFGVGLIILFSVIAILVIFNTITLTIYNRKEEVEIMRLVGATNWYIRGPFLVESFLYSFIASILTSLLLIPIFAKVIPAIDHFVSPQVSIFNRNIFNYWYLVLFLLLVSLVLSLFTTLVTIRRYLKI